MNSGDDNRTSEDLFAATLLGDSEDEKAWDAVKTLRLRGTQEVFEIAKRYCRSHDPGENSRGLDVLGGLCEGNAERPFLAESVSIAREAIGAQDIRVVRS